MKIFKPFLDFGISIGIILILSVLIVNILGDSFSFDEETLLWFTSTIAQTFGALLAIVIALGLHSRASILNWIASRNMKDKMKIFKDKEEQVWERLYLPLVSMGGLVIVSLTSMTFVKSSYTYENAILSFIFILLILLSIYTIIVLMYAIAMTFGQE